MQAQLDQQLKSENIAISWLERSFMAGDTRSLYVAGEDINFQWSIHEVMEFDERWKKGIKRGKTSPQLIAELAEYFGRQPEDIVILVIDRGMKGKIG
ncbi:hypothetical protein [Metabacillus fastidiosus]|uniref:Uncharacterized protein n=1 Tax=Metabacillus fastidiosus TaxID=1458 RepID=A0ABU6NRM7_9BACI|nr:hypothetical protein [Metabacillus fastidiosus]